MEKVTLWEIIGETIMFWSVEYSRGGLIVFVPSSKTDISLPNEALVEQFSAMKMLNMQALLDWIVKCKFQFIHKQAIKFFGLICGYKKTISSLCSKGSKEREIRFSSIVIEFNEFIMNPKGLA